MKKLLSLTMAVILAVFMFSCDDSSTEPKEEQATEFEKITERGNEYIANYTNAAGEGVNISISDLYGILTDGDTSNDPLLLDYRSETLFNERHIIGAMNVTYDDLVDLINDGTIPKDRTVVNMCYSGQGASRATAFMNLIGYQAKNLLFGHCGVDTSLTSAQGWVSQTAADEYINMETTTNSTTTTYDFPAVNTGETDTDEIIKARWDDLMAAGGGSVSAADVWANPSNYFVINYWPADEYANPGHITGAYQFTPKTSLGADEMLDLLPTDQTIVVYCYTGQTSSQVVTYLRMLGYDAVSLSYGFNGFAYNLLSGHKYTAPAPGAYDTILTP